ncbi:nucleolar protein [Thecaphora frezii]
MPPANKAAPKAAKAVSSTSAAARSAKPKPTATTKAEKAAAAAAITASPAATKKSVRLAAGNNKDTLTKASKKQSNAKALDAQAEPKKKLSSKAAAKKQADTTHAEDTTEEPAKKAGNGKKRARDADEDKSASKQEDDAAVPVAAKKAAKGMAKKQQATKAAAKAVEAEEKEEAEAAQEEVQDAEAALDEQEIIKGFSDVSGSDDDADSSDEEDDDDVEAGKNASILTVKLPNAKDDHSVKQRLDKVAKRKEANKTAEVPATLYFGRLPRGLYEDQLRGYLSQFGDVRRLRVSRNRKTGKPKHYAFVEFADKDVAAIVQETMNNYLIDGHLLQVKEVPKDKIHPKLWIGANRKYRAVPVDRIERVRRSKPKTDEEQAKHDAKLLKRQEARREKIKGAGIDYEFEGYKIEA